MANLTELAADSGDKALLAKIREVEGAWRATRLARGLGRAAGAQGAADALGINMDSLHQGQVDYQATVNRRAPSHVVTAPADGDFQLLRSRELYGVRDIHQPSALSD